METNYSNNSNLKFPVNNGFRLLLVFSVRLLNQINNFELFHILSVHANQIKTHIELVLIFKKKNQVLFNASF